MNQGSLIFSDGGQLIFIKTFLQEPYTVVI